MTFGRYVPWLMYIPDRKICELYFITKRYTKIFKEVVDLLSAEKIGIISIDTYSLPVEKKIEVFMFIDLTDSITDINALRERIEKMIGIEVHYKCAKSKGFMVGEFAFPLYVFPNVRSIIILGEDFQKMIKAMQERLGKIAGVYLYHLAFSGGKYMGNYIKSMLKLKERDLIAEVLKIYQAAGWGRIELVKFDIDRPELIIRVYGSIECSAFKGLGKPASHFMRGHLSGLLSSLLDTNITLIETKCIAKGDPYCEFSLLRKS